MTDFEMEAAFGGPWDSGFFWVKKPNYNSRGEYVGQLDSPPHEAHVMDYYWHLSGFQYLAFYAGQKQKQPSQDQFRSNAFEQAARVVDVTLLREAIKQERAERSCRQESDPL